MNLSLTSEIILGRDIQTNAPITLTDRDVTSHLDIIGKIGSGKTSLQEFIALQFIARGIGVCYVDPHGDAIDYLIRHMPPTRLKDVILIAPGNDDIQTAIGMPLIYRTARSIDKDVNRLLNIFKQIWGPDSEMPFYGPRLELILTMCIKTLLLTGYTFSEFPLLLRVEEFKKRVLKELQEKHADQNVLSFMWELDFNKLSNYLQHEKSESTLYKIYRLLDTEAVPLIASQPKETLHWRSVTDGNKIVLLDLSNLDEETQKFLAAIFLSTFFEAAFSRQDIPEYRRTLYALVIDEFNKFAFPQMAEVFRELRKYAVSVTVGYQVRSMMSQPLQGALQNVANHIAFTIGKDDAIELASTFAHPPQPEYEDREKKLLTARPIDYLVLAGRPHNSQDVTTFCNSLEERVKHLNRPAMSSGHVPSGGEGNTFIYNSTSNLFGEQSYPTDLTTKYDRRRGLDDLNKLLLTAMETKNPRQIVPSETLDFILSSSTLIPKKVAQTKIAILKTREDLEDALRNLRNEKELLSPTLYEKLWLVPESEIASLFKQHNHEKRQQYNYWYTYLTYQLESCLFNLLIPASVYHGYNENETGPEFGSQTYENRKQNETNEMTGRQWEAYIDAFNRYDLAFLKLPPRWLSWRRTSPWIHTKGWRTTDAPWKVIGYPTEGAKPIIEQAIREEAQRRAKEESDRTKPLEIYEETALIEEMIQLLRRVFVALAADPILVRTGEMELVEVRRRPVADMIKEMELELQRLPKYTAMVNRRGYDSEGVHIEMVPPELVDALFPPSTNVEARMRELIAQTNTYGTVKEEVKAWLRARHTNFLKPQVVEKKLPEKSLPAPQFIAPQSTTPHPLISSPDYLTILYYLSNVTLQQAMRLTQTTDSKKEREKLNRLVNEGLVEASSATFLAGGGRAPLVYSLKKKSYDRLLDERGLAPIKQGDFSMHSYTVNEVLIRILTSGLPVVDFTHEKHFHQKPIPLGKQGLEPDGYIGLPNKSFYIEVDLGTETNSMIKEKIEKYLLAIQTNAHIGFTRPFTIAFITQEIHRFQPLLPPANASFFVGSVEQLLTQRA